MKKFRIRAAVTGRFGCEYYYDPEDYAEEVIFADNEDEAEVKFINKLRENMSKDLEIDDITIQDLGAPMLYLHTRNDAYRAEECGIKTLKVSELMDILAEYDEDSPVVLVNNGGIFPVYGYINECSFEEEKSEDD